MQYELIGSKRASGAAYIVQFCDFVPPEHLDRPWVVVDTMLGVLLSSHYTQNDAEKFCEWICEDEKKEGYDA